MDTPPIEEWDRCQITFRTRYSFGGGEHAGMNSGLLWFEAEAHGLRGRYIAGRSPETPLAREAEGFPNQRNPVHLSLHQQLVDLLVEAGWQPVTERGASWWERKFRRRR